MINYPRLQAIKFNDNKTSHLVGLSQDTESGSVLCATGIENL